MDREACKASLIYFSNTLAQTQGWEEPRRPVNAILLSGWQRQVQEKPAILFAAPKHRHLF